MDANFTDLNWTGLNGTLHFDQNIVGHIGSIGGSVSYWRWYHFLEIVGTLFNGIKYDAISLGWFDFWILLFFAFSSGCIFILLTLFFSRETIPKVKESELDGVRVWDRVK